MSNTIVIVFTIVIVVCLFMLVKRALTNVSKINNVLVNVEININKD